MSSPDSPSGSPGAAAGPSGFADGVHMTFHVSSACSVYAPALR
jgi:hypothetical protein